MSFFLTNLHFKGKPTSDIGSRFIQKEYSVITYDHRLYINSIDNTTSISIATPETPSTEGVVAGKQTRLSVSLISPGLQEKTSSWKSVHYFDIILHVQPDGRGNIEVGWRLVSPRGQDPHRPGPGRLPQTCSPLPPSGPPPAWPRPPPSQAPTHPPPPQPALSVCHRVCEVAHQVAPCPPSKEAPAIWVTVGLKRRRGFALLHREEEKRGRVCARPCVASEHAD